MNDNPKSNNVEKKEEILKKKSLNSNNVNKKVNNKDSIRKQKRLCQMQKRLAFFNEEDFQELESETNIKFNEDSNELNSFNFRKKLGHIHTTNKKHCKINLSFNCNNSRKDNLNIEQIPYKKSHENQNSKNNLEKIIPEKIEQEFELPNLKEEEISLKKKNTYSNTNDEDKASTEALFPNESEINRKKSKSNLHNDSLEKDVFNKIINGDMDENPNIFSGSNDNNEIEEDNIEKDELDFQVNLMNNFDFNNIINNEPGSKDENIENDNSVIINETDQENNINENNEDEEENKEDSNVELNISNLEIDINEIKEEDNTQNDDELIISGPNSNEFAKKYLSSKSKSFIKFNNNLTARVAADNLKNSLSYILALCPELMGGIDKKNLIKENYAATDVISEDIEAENFTPRQSEKIDEIPGKKINGERIKNNNGLNTKDFLTNKTFRNKEIKNPLEIKKSEKENSPKTHYKNRSKIDRNTFNNIHDFDNEINNNNNFTKEKKPIKTKSIYSNINNENNAIYSNYNTNNDKYRNNTIKNTEHIKIKYRHQKAKSLVNNNNQIDSCNLNLNSNIKNKQHSPKQTSAIFNKKNTINKILYKNIDNKKKKTNISKEKETDHFYNKQNYSSNDNNKKSYQKYFKKSNSNVYSNTMAKNHANCKSDIRDKVFDIKKKFTFVRKTNASDLSKSNNFIHKKSIGNNDNGNKICFTEKTNKSKNCTSFISHIKKNTPDNINNVSEQNINHSKKLSQQITDGYKFFMNSISTNKNINNRYNNNDSKKNIKRKRIGSNNFTIKSTPLSNYFSFNKNKTNNTNCNNNVTFIKKSTTIKEDKTSHIVPNHNKSKTSFITPSYQNLNQTKNRLLKKNFTLINNNKSKKTNEISTKNIRKNYIKKINNKFNEIKKIVNDSSVKIVHKKINTIGQPNELNKLLNSNSNIRINKQLKDSSSYSNYKKNFNKHKIIMALQHIKFSPMANYSKVLNELYKSKKNLFVILVYTDSIKRYIFRGLYEVNSNDKKIANKIFAPGYGQNKLNISRLNNFFNYQSNNGDFIRIKFNNEGEKKFNSDTIIVY